MTIKIQRLLARAKKHLKNREIHEARINYESVLKLLPKNQEAKKGLLAVNQTININPTQDQLDKVVKLYSSGQIQTALESLNVLINTFPQESSLFNIRGACFKALNQIKPAIENFEKAIKIKQDYAEAHFNLGFMLNECGEFHKSILSYESAISYKPAYPAAHNNLGLIFLELGNLDSAVKSFEWAIAYSPNFAQAFNNLGATLQRLGQYNKAMGQFEQAVTFNPSYDQAFNNLGIICEILGLPKKALHHYMSAIKSNPEFAEAYRNLSRIKKFTENDPLIPQMELLFSKSDLNLSDTIKLCFALAKANDDLGNYEKFFKLLNKGNRLRKQELNYSLDESKKFHANLIKFFNPASPLIKKSSYKNSNIQPIFIVGMPRSGTTLLEQIISNHHAVYGAGELTNFKEAVSPILASHLNQNTFNLNEADLLTIRNQYLDSLSSLNTPESIITDKMPLNFRLIGLILSSIPEAKIIHLKRDSMATCWSIYKHYFATGNGFSFNQKDLGEFYNLYKELMDFWHELFPNKIYDISYEDLTINQEEETQKLLKYCQLDWDDNCLTFYKNKRAVHTASSSQVRKEMYQGSSEAWKKYETNLKLLINTLKYK